MSKVGKWSKHGAGSPMRYDTICDYVGYLGRMLKLSSHDWTRPVVTESEQTRLALQAVKRLDGAAKQRARPITADEVKTACAGVYGSIGFKLTFRVILLTGWLGALRLGQLLPSGKATKKQMMLQDLEVNERARSVYISSRRSKTNVFRERAHTIEIPEAAGSGLDLYTALQELLAYRRQQGLPLNVRICELDAGLATFAKFVAVLGKLIPPRAPTIYVKGHVTGHSLRRGFTVAALEAGFSIDQIMLHGDWKQPSSILSAYSVGAVLPSIALNSFHERRSNLVRPANVLNRAWASPAAGQAPGVAGAVAEASVAPQAQAMPGPQLATAAVARAVGPRRFSATNPFLVPGEPGKSVDAAGDSFNWMRLKRARQWEDEHRP